VFFCSESLIVSNIEMAVRADIQAQRTDLACLRVDRQGNQFGNPILFVDLQDLGRMFGVVEIGHGKEDVAVFVQDHTIWSVVFFWQLHGKGGFYQAGVFSPTSRE